MTDSFLIDVNHVTHRYGSLTALDDVTFQVPSGSMFGLLGPNGGGKSTLFKIFSTQLLPSAGNISISGLNLYDNPDEIRNRLAVVFQHPSIDTKLTVRENLRHHGWLYGLRGRDLSDRIAEILRRFTLKTRAGDRVETLSGGMRRKVEIAKGVLSRPEILLMDEPSTGLDPGARRDLWELIRELNRNDSITIVVTTHLMDEAENCDTIGILDQGHLVTIGSPGELKKSVGSQVIEIQTDHVDGVISFLKTQYAADFTTLENKVLFEHRRGHELIPELMEALASEVSGIAVRQPTLEDVFIHYTGRRFEEPTENRLGMTNDQS